MPVEQKEYLQKIADLLVAGERDQLSAIVQECIDKNIAKPFQILQDGLGLGMKVIGEKWERKEIFVPEALVSVDAMNGGLEILLPLIRAEIKARGKSESPGSVVIGVVEGDIHDIGKTIVKALLEAAGFDVYDLGRDVPADDFIKTAIEKGCQVIATSTLMTPTLEVMSELEGKLKEQGLKGKVKTIIGGGATSEEYATDIGADKYAKDAVEGVDAIRKMVDEVKVAISELKKRLGE